MADLTLLVLAAGMGSRYGGLKQLDPFGPHGETIMDYSVYDALRAGFNKVVFVIRMDIEEAFREKIGTRYEKHVAVDYVFQELWKLPAGYAAPAERTKPWGTTHAILMAADAIREPFAVINADDFYGAEGYRALAQCLTSGTADYAMVGYLLSKTLSDFGPVARGVCHVDADGFLKDIVEMKSLARDGADAVNTDADGRQTQLPGDTAVSMNMWGFTPPVFDQLRNHFLGFLKLHANDLTAECYVPSTMNELIQAGEARVKVLRSAGTWFGVTYREDRPRVVESLHRFIEDGYYPRRLWA
jgi:NDP-sugar pyrophosphorylase family protein